MRGNLVTRDDLEEINNYKTTFHGRVTVADQAGPAADFIDDVISDMERRGSIARRSRNR